LKTRHEVISNAVWRFLQLRKYIDNKHQLMHWGKVLQASLSVTGSNKDQEEAVFVAVELLRLKLLNADTMFGGFSGAPVHGSGAIASYTEMGLRLELTEEQMSTSAIACWYHGSPP
jgi:hypothetical protein